MPSKEQTQVDVYKDLSRPGISHECADEVRAPQWCTETVRPFPVSLLQENLQSRIEGKKMGYAYYDVIGSLGVIMIVGSYFLVQIRRMSSTGLPYTAVNGLGAALILVSLYFDFNLPAFLVELFWLLISLIGLGRIGLERRRAA
jgi:hypothetical protein